jgi:hypothetical protein
MVAVRNAQQQDNVGEVSVAIAAGDAERNVVELDLGHRRAVSEAEAGSNEVAGLLVQRRLLRAGMRNETRQGEREQEGAHGLLAK